MLRLAVDVALEKLDETSIGITIEDAFELASDCGKVEQSILLWSSSP